MWEEFKGYKELWIIILMFFYFIVFIVGFFGNIFVIVIVFYYKYMWILINVFLVNLVISDLLVVFFCILIMLGMYVYKDYVYGIGMCKLMLFF